jgi:hypothetical protein
MLHASSPSASQQVLVEARLVSYHAAMTSPSQDLHGYSPDRSQEQAPLVTDMDRDPISLLEAVAASIAAVCSPRT